MKLSVIIKRFLKDDLCYPTDFYLIDMNAVKKNVPNIFKRVLLIVAFYFVSTLYCIGYYLLMPFRILFEWCESWCY